MNVTQKIADATDRRILKELSADARITNNELAERVGLSASACLRRLEETGVIKGYSAIIDPAVEGWTMTALASVRLSRQHDDEIQEDGGVIIGRETLPAPSHHHRTKGYGVTPSWRSAA